tara:strand:- start:12960 stop:13559 length:600 start_codon:yes stop_codon:yes gene_type:complete
MGWGTLVLLFGASVTILCAPGAFGHALGDFPRTAWLAFTWAALGGLPPLPRMRMVPLRVIAATLIAVALTAMWMDHRSGRAIEWTTLSGLVVVPLLVLAASRSARDATAAGMYAGFWCCLVALPALLSAVVGWDGVRGGGPDWLVRASGFSPLTWTWEGAPPRFTPVLVALVLLAAGWLAGDGVDAIEVAQDFDEEDEA